MNWTSYAQIDRSPSGEPTLAHAFPVTTLARDHHPAVVQVGLSYGGLTRRFAFDRPKVEHRPGLGGGVLIIEQDLLHAWEATETRMSFDWAVSNLQVVIAGIGARASFGGSAADLVRLSALDRSSGVRGLAPDLSLPDLPEWESRSRIATYRAAGLTHEAIHGIPESRPGTSGSARILATYPVPVADIAFQLTSAETGQGHWATTANPRPQKIEIQDVRFCLG